MGCVLYSKRGVNEGGEIQKAGGPGFMWLCCACFSAKATRPRRKSRGGKQSYPLMTGKEGGDAGRDHGRNGTKANQAKSTATKVPSYNIADRVHKRTGKGEEGSGLLTLAILRPMKGPVSAEKRKCSAAEEQLQHE